MEDSDTVRFLDRYLGSFICLIFSFLNRLKRKRRVNSVKNVLIIELFEMGAAVMAYSSIRYIKKKLNNPNIYCLCSEQIRESWELLDTIPEKNILSIDDKSLLAFAISLMKQIIFLRKKNLDLIIDFELFMRISSIIAFLVKSKITAAFYRYELEGLYRGNFYDLNCSFNQNTHISKNFLALTKTAVKKAENYPNYKSGIKTSEIMVPTYKSNPELKNRIRGKIKRLYSSYDKNDIILVVPDVGKVLSVRNYPYFVDVIKKLLAHYKDSLILLIGVNENWPVCSSIAKRVNNKRCINFCNQTSSLKELLALMTLSRLLIVNDNGPAHFASLTPIKTLALFSTDSPFIYGPLGDCVILYSFFHCSPCISAFNHKHSKCKNNLCLKSISPDKVFDYSVRIMEDKLTYGTINNEICYLI